MEWQKIETAPKDGTELLIYTEELGRVVLYFCDHVKPGRWLSGFNDDDVLTLTHWMPLPAPPESKND